MHNEDRTSKTGADTDGPLAPTLSLDTVLELLANRDRRFALYSLIDTSGRVADFEPLVEDVATLAAGVEGEPLTRDRYFGIAADLYHWHLPVLADVGVVEFDERTRTLRYRPHCTLESWVHRVRRDELR